MRRVVISNNRRRNSQPARQRCATHFPTYAAIVERTRSRRLASANSMSMAAAAMRLHAAAHAVARACASQTHRSTRTRSVRLRFDTSVASSRLERLMCVIYASIWWRRVGRRTGAITGRVTFIAAATCTRARVRRFVAAHAMRIFAGKREHVYHPVLFAFTGVCNVFSWVRVDFMFRNYGAVLAEWT